MKRLRSYQCCRRKPQWPSSTWRSAPDLGWPCWARRSPGRDWRRRHLCCLTPGASTWSGCGARPGHCRWTGRRWRTSCARGRRWPPLPGKAGHMLVEKQGRHVRLRDSQYGVGFSASLIDIIWSWTEWTLWVVFFQSSPLRPSLPDCGLPSTTTNSSQSLVDWPPYPLVEASSY